MKLTLKDVSVDELRASPITARISDRFWPEGVVHLVIDSTTAAHSNQPVAWTILAIGTGCFGSELLVKRIRNPLAKYAALLGIVAIVYMAA